MRDSNFDIKKAFKMMTRSGQGDSISREELGEILGLDTPHRDILFARFKKNNTTSDTVSYAEVSIDFP
jgi:Ca2+-binding EF-hand superfamily protein